MKRESAKHAAYRQELVRSRVAVFDRCGGVCERCHTNLAQVIHHKLRRSQGGSNDLENLAGLCQEPCHREIHENPEQAYDDGWLIRGVSTGHTVGTD